MKALNFEDYKKLNESVRYHVDNKLSLTESIYRIDSESYNEFVNEVRRLHFDGKIKLSDNDKFIVENLKTGTKAIYKPRGGNQKDVKLDSPKRGGRKKFVVYRDSGKKDDDGNIIAQIIEWGDTKLSVKNCDEGARKSFLARQRCDKWTLEKDGMNARWWACNVHRFWKELGLECDKPW